MCSTKKVFLKISQNSQDKVAGLKPQASNFIRKETVTQVLSTYGRLFLKFWFEYFSKDSYHISKNVVSKNYKLMLLVHKKENYPEIIKINITKLFL